MNLDPQTRLKNSGTNQWTNGSMLTSNGAGQGIDGLQNALFIFNPQETLVGVVLTLLKNNFYSVKSYLPGKYKLVSA